MMIVGPISTDETFYTKQKEKGILYLKIATCASWFPINLKSTENSKN